MEDDKLPFLDHLEELRRRLIICLLAAVLGMGVAYSFLDPILEWLLAPVGQVVFIRPLEAFMTRLKCALAGGVLLALPVIVYQVWRFLIPALHRSERRVLFSVVPVSLGLFLGGAAFAYCAVLPVMLRFLLDPGTPLIQQAISFDYYVTFVLYFGLAFGLVFQLPLLVYVLMYCRIVPEDFFSRHRRTAILSIFIVSALMTGPDVFSQIFLALPTWFLYEASVFTARRAMRRRVKDRID